jgi:ankyrin repeat protein
VVQLLLDAQADVNVAAANGYAPLHEAAYHGHTEIVQLLLNAQAAVDAVGVDLRSSSCRSLISALHLAASRGHTAVVQLLVNADAAVNAADAQGCTDLHKAAGTGSMAVVQLLLDAQADVNAAAAAAANGYRALHEAAFGGHTAVAQLLINAGAVVDAAGTDGWTALHCAVENGQTAVVQLLLDAHADVNCDAGGSTPFYLAADAGHTETVQLLLTAPDLATESIADGLGAAAGHAELAVTILQALMSRDIPAAAAELAQTGRHSLARNVLSQWQAAEEAEKEQEARWPALQQLLVGIATAHQQLREAAADVVTFSVKAAVQGVTPGFNEAAWDAAVRDAAGNADAVAATGDAAASSPQA